MNRARPLTFAALAAVAVLGCCDTASAQPVLTVTPATVTNSNTPLQFNNIPSGGVSPAETVTVGSTDMLGHTVILQVAPGQDQSWLTVLPGGSLNIPATLSIQCNTTNLTSGTYNGSFTVTVDGAPEDFVTVYVQLIVSGTSLLNALPPSLAFSAQEGASAATPNGTSVQILSSGVPLNYNLTARTTNGGNWLLLSATQGITGGAPFTVSVNPSNLTSTAFPALFDGTITASSTSTLDAVQIPVQLTLNANALLSVTPTNPPPFLYQAGSAADPAAEQLAISSANGSIVFSIQESPPVSWLVLSALGGTAGNTPDMITMNATPKEQGLQPNTYTTNLIVTPSGEAALAPIPVSLVVAAHPLLSLSTNSLSFTAPFGGTPPSAQSVTVNGNTVGFAATSNASWLTVSPSSGTTPASLTVAVNTAGLAIQNYSGTITIAPTNGDPYTETVAVSLNVTSASALVAGPASLLFSYEIGQTPPQAQAIQISTTGQPINFTVSGATTTCGPNWLTAFASSQTVSMTANTTLTIGVSVGGQAAGTCSGTISLNYYNGLINTSLPINVTLAVSGSAELSVAVTPGFGLATGTLNSAPFYQEIALTSTDPFTQVGFNAELLNVGGGGSWLSLSGSTNGTTPQNLYLQYSPAAVTTPGTYTGTLVILSGSLGSASLSIPITLTVTSTTSVSVSPASLTFTQTQGGTGSPPAAQAITISSNPGTATYTAVVSSADGNWLQISPSSGNANTQVQVSIVPALANMLSQGSHTAQISFVFQEAATTSAIVNVTLNVTAPQTVTASPPSLTFAYQIGGTPPPAVPLTVTSSGGAVAINVSATSTSGWLSVGASSGSTPQTINVSVNPAGLTAQSYGGSISIAAPGVLATPLSIPVVFIVTAPPAPQPVVILNNATNAPGVISVGEEIAIKGSNLGPSTGVLFSENPSGGVPNILSGVQVTFDNIPGTPIYVSANQINVMVPYEINGRLSTTMVVLYNGAPSFPFQLSVAPAAPGLFTDNLSGSGQVAALNQDYTFNGSGAGFAAAPRGTVISLFGTGGGETNPISATGSVTPIPTSPSGLFNIPNVTATVGGLPATVEFAGAAPGLVTGVFQVNVLIPANVTPGSSVPVTVAIGNVSTPAGTTVAVQ